MQNYSSAKRRKNQIKIAFYMNRLWMGGSEKAMLSLIQRLLNYYDITVVYDHDNNDLTVIKEIMNYVK